MIKHVSNDENKYDNNKENINNFENEDISLEASNTDNFYDDKEMIDIKHLNKKEDEG